MKNCAHLAFMTGFVRVMGNFGILLTWIVLAAYLMSHTAFFTSSDWVANNVTNKAACIAGVWLGTNTWFCVLSYSVSRGHGKFSDITLLRMQHFRLLPAPGGILWRRARRLATGASPDLKVQLDGRIE